uniref:Uncharacterized protein n=1 Tax=Arundo donax TaxID=35708 RepID=A0A0A9DDE3_ARUDO
MCLKTTLLTYQLRSNKHIRVMDHSTSLVLLCQDLELSTPCKNIRTTCLLQAYNNNNNNDLLPRLSLVMGALEALVIFKEISSLIRILALHQLSVLMKH